MDSLSPRAIDNLLIGFVLFLLCPFHLCGQIVANCRYLLYYFPFFHFLLALSEKNPTNYAEND